MHALMVRASSFTLHQSCTDHRSDDARGEIPQTRRHRSIRGPVSLRSAVRCEEAGQTDRRSFTVTALAYQGATCDRTLRLDRRYGTLLEVRRPPCTLGNASLFF